MANESKESKKAKPSPAKASQPEREAKPDKAEKDAQAKAAETSKQSGRSALYLAAAAIVVIVIIAAVVFLVVVPGVSGVPFSTFKSNFQTAPRVAVAVTYNNQSQFVSEVQCYATMLEIIGRTRNASTIDFLLMNRTSCEYSPTGLGASSGTLTVNASACVEIANNEPSVFLNYSSSNSTRVTADHLYLDADAAYLASCPIAAEFG